MKSRLDGSFSTPLVMFLGDDIDEEDHNLLFPALRARGVSVIRVHPDDLVTRMDDTGITFSVAGKTITPDLVVGWVLDDLLVQGMALLDVIARAGIPVINDALTLFRAQNKYIDSSMLQRGGALRYPVIAGRNTQALATWLQELDGPAVIKPFVGFGGRGLEKLDGKEAGEAFVDKLSASGEDFYAVPWIDNPGRDIRVYTINHHAVFAIYRYAPPGEWITNVRAGGVIAMCPISKEIAELAEQASRAAGTLIGGVDLGEDTTHGQLVVYEVNSCPTCEPPALEALADFLAAAVDNVETALNTWKPSKIWDTFDDNPDLFHPSKQRLLE